MCACFTDGAPLRGILFNRHLHTFTTTAQFVLGRHFSGGYHDQWSGVPLPLVFLVKLNALNCYVCCRVHSASSALGYWQRPEATAETFQATLAAEDGPTATRYLRTGDLGYVVDGKLFVCSRIKDTIIIGGKNYYPADLESTLITVAPQLRPGCMAAVPVTAPGRNGRFSHALTLLA